MKIWEVLYDLDGAASRSQVRARDAEHAIKVWKRDHPKVGVRAIQHVVRLSR